MRNTIPLIKSIAVPILCQLMFLVTGFSQEVSRPLHEVSSSNSINALENIEELVYDLFHKPECFVISNISTNDSGHGIASFEKGEFLDIGLDAGIVLSTGSVSEIYGPNKGSSDASSNNNLDSDDDLAALVPFPIFNAVSLQFDFIPTSDKLSFTMVFASEEYPEYVCTRFNDAVGIFLEKLGTNEKTNVAFIPGTELPISVNTLNQGTKGSYGSDPLCISLDHSDKYVDNSMIGSTRSKLDGFSVPMSMQIDGMETCAQYRLKIVIADGADKSLDSAIFLETGSLVGGNGLSIDAVGYYQDGSKRAVEGCEPAFFRFTRPEHYPIDVPYTVKLSYGGTAEFGVDYEPLPDEITIQPGQMEYILPVQAVVDYGDPDNVQDLYEGDEFLVVTTNLKECSCSRDFISQTMIIENRAPLTFDHTICPGEVYILPDGTEATVGGEYSGPNLTIPDPDFPDCDKVYWGILTVLPTWDERFDVKFCPGDDLILPNGDEVDEEGEYTYNYTSYVGCDSTVTYVVGFFDESFEERNLEACFGDEVVLPGTMQIVTPEPGNHNFEWTGLNRNGCDSTIVTQLIVHPSYHIEDEKEFCEGEVYVDQNGDEIIKTSTKTYNYKSINGCDSIEQVTYTFHKADYEIDDQTVFICEDNVNSDPRITGGNGTYEEHFLNQYGCDSTVLRTYEVIKKEYTNDLVEVCGIQELQLPSGKVVNESGIFMDTLLNRYGCDSIISYEIRMQQVMLANAFTPNGDGKNDFLFISNPNVCGLEEIKVQVFDRWGDMVYEGSDPDHMWDGIMKNGEPANSGIYIVSGEYSIVDEMGTTVTNRINGTVNLLR